jgi:hypothetical protein
MQRENSSLDMTKPLFNPTFIEIWSKEHVGCSTKRRSSFRLI